MRHAFSLSEILITISIIGVVSAITIPSLIQKQIDRANVAKLQKVYSTLSQALLRAKEDQGDFSTWLVENSNTGTARLFSYIEPYIRVIKKCTNQPGCWASNTKSLSGNTAKFSQNGRMGSTDVYSFILSDGTNITLDVYNLKYYYTGIDDNIVKGDLLIAFYVDVNGNKGPNVVGRDIFGFALGDNGLVPFGISNNSKYCTPSRNSDIDGFDCAYKVLQKKAIKY